MVDTWNACVAHNTGIDVAVVRDTDSSLLLKHHHSFETWTSFVVVSLIDEKINIKKSEQWSFSSRR
jgi:hypothetical protein